MTRAVQNCLVTDVAMVARARELLFLGEKDVNANSAGHGRS